MQIIALAQCIVLWIKVISDSQISNYNFLCTSIKLSEVSLIKKRQERRDQYADLKAETSESCIKISSDTLFKVVFLKVENFEENGYRTL